MVEKCFDNSGQVLLLSYRFKSWSPAVPSKVICLEMFVMLLREYYLVFLFLMMISTQLCLEVSVQLLGRILESSIDSEDGAEDLAVEAFDEPEAAAVRSSNVLWSLATTPGDGAATRRSALGKAPRPVLHLLRTQDLATVDAASREEVYRHNDACLQEMGLEAFEQKLRSCS